MEVTRVSPRGDGVVPAEDVAAALRPDTRLVALMLANNELGTLQPVAAVAAACRERGIPVLCDAVQAVGKIPVDAPALGVDYLVLGAHKFYGPLGAAALWVRKGVELSGYLVGGSQERRRRAGTENVPAIVGLGAAAAVGPRGDGGARSAHLAALRDRFEAALPARVPGAILHCQGSPRLPNTSHVAVPGVGGRVAADPPRPRRLRGLDRLGLLLGERRAQQDAARHRHLARGGALLAAGELRHRQHARRRSTPSSTRWRARRPSCGGRWRDVREDGRGSDRRRHERRPRLLGHRLAAGPRGAAGGRPLHAPLGPVERRGARPLLRRPRPRRRPAGGAAGGHPPLHPAPGPGVPRQGGRSLRRRLPRRPHAEPLRALQHLDQVRPPARARAAARRVPGGDRPLRPHPRRPRGARAAHRRRHREGPELLPLRADRRAARRLALSARRADQAARCGRSPARPASWWPRRGRAWRSASWPAASASSWTPRPPPTPSASPVADCPGSPSRRCWSTPRAEELGAGQPYYRYTVGQRKGLGIAAPSPLYVLQIEPEQNRVVVGGEAELMAPGLAGERLHWIGPPPAELAAAARSRPR